MLVKVVCGERRRATRLDGSLSDRQVFINAKRIMGLYGVRGTKVDTGDKVSFYPAYGDHPVMHVIYDEEGL